MNKRRLYKALNHKDVRSLNEAEYFAEKRGKKLNTMITVHPKRLALYPNDVGHWVWWLLNKLRIWCERDRGFGYFAIWVRENYEGDRREHLHMLLCVPERERTKLEDTLRSWLPGDEKAVHVGRPEYKRDSYGQRVNKALTYLLKQMTPQARYALDRRVRREKHCRDTGAPVAAVLGKRCGVSRSLDARARKSFWLMRTPHTADAAERRARSA
jgi:hypothetical protein